MTRPKYKELYLETKRELENLQFDFDTVKKAKLELESHLAEYGEILFNKIEVEAKEATSEGSTRPTIRIVEPREHSALECFIKTQAMFRSYMCETGYNQGLNHLRVNGIDIINSKWERTKP